jgi:hypothetical protein
MASARFSSDVLQMFSPEAILEKIQKYHHNKAKEKIRQRNEKGWMKINKEIIDYWEYKQNKEFVPSYIEKNEEEIKEVEKFHFKLSLSENPLEGWNWIKERFARKLHEKLFKSDKEYRIKAKTAIFNGRPFCPFSRREAKWITTEDERNDKIQGLCYGCFFQGIYHKALSVKGTELWEKDVFTKDSALKISEKEKSELFYKDDGRKGKEQKKRMEAHYKLYERLYVMMGSLPRA